MNALYVWGGWEGGKNKFETILSWLRHWCRKLSLWKNWRSWKTLFQERSGIFGRTAAVQSRICVYAQSTMGSASPALQAVTAFHAHTAPSNVYWKCGISRHALWGLIKYTEQACLRLPNTQQSSLNCSSKQTTDVWQFWKNVQNPQIPLEECCWLWARDCKTMRLWEINTCKPCSFWEKRSGISGKVSQQFHLQCIKTNI